MRRGLAVAVGAIVRVLLALWRVVRGLLIAATAALVPAVAVAVALALLVFVLLPGTVPEPRPVPEARPTVVTAADGSLLAVLVDFELSLPLDPDDIPASVVDAVVATEDRRFFDHDGVDLLGVARAVRANLDGGRQGGSTITQQLVKLRYLTDAPTADRKVREAIIAQQLEQRLSKDEILHAYLSAAYFGSGATGLAAAAQRYFRKDPGDLGVSEAALLAGMLPAPARFSPHVDPAAAEAARARSLNAMADVGVLDAAGLAAELDGGKVVLLDADGAPPPGTTGTFTGVWPLPVSELGPFPYVAAWVEQYLIDRYGPGAIGRGLAVTVTIDPELQQLAEQSVAAAVAGAGDPQVAAALAAVEPATGFVRAAAGSQRFQDSQVDLARGGSTGFPVGSTAKVFTLVSALEAGASPARTVSAPRAFTTPDGSVVRNFGGAAGGAMSLRQATVESWNTPFVALALELGPGTVAEAARRAGVVSWSAERDYGPSVTLGTYETSPLEMAAAFATFANRGQAVDPVVVQRVVDSSGRVLEDNTVRAARPVFDPVVAANVTDVLTGVVESGTGIAADIGRPAAGKTGTAEDFSAAWFVGYTPQLSAAVWVGHADGLRRLPPLGGVAEVTGGSVPASTWAAFMRSALDGTPPLGFPPALPLRFAGPRPDLPGPPPEEREPERRDPVVVGPAGPPTPRVVTPTG